MWMRGDASIPMYYLLYGSSYLADIPRTFPNNLRFKEEVGPDSLRPALRRVLSAHAVHNPDVGYCQVKEACSFIFEV